MSTLKDWRVLLLALLFVLSVAMLGCSSMLDAVTPAYVPEDAILYVDPNDGHTITTLLLAKQLRVQIEHKHRDTMTDLRRAAEDDTVRYADAVVYTDYAVAQAQAFQNTLVAGSDGTGGIGLAQILAGFGLGGSLGLFLRKPGDKTPAEIEADKAKAVAETKAMMGGNGGPTV
jgi:hypothetical protein